MDNLEISVLITSISRKVSLIKSLRKAYVKLKITGKIYGGDTNKACIGKYFVDEFWHMPKLSDLTVTELISYCYQRRISAIIPTRDGELGFFAMHKQVLEKAGIQVMISDLMPVQTCLDKLLFFEFLSARSFSGIKTTAEIAEIQSKYYVVKERFGAGSCSIGLKLTQQQAVQHASHLETAIFQPYIAGREYSVDLYIGQNKKTQGVIVRSRDVIEHGESQVTTTVRNEILEKSCAMLAEALELYGHVVFQIIVDEQGRFYFIECNSRFGGASSLSLAAGLESYYWFLLECMGEDLTNYPFVRSNLEKRQIRYAEDLIIDGDSF